MKEQNIGKVINEEKVLRLLALHDAGITPLL